LQWQNCCNFYTLNLISFLNTHIEKKTSPELKFSEALTKNILILISAITAGLPRKLTLMFGRWLGTFIYVFIPLRKKVALKNLHLAFPEKTESEIYRILKSCYRHFGMVMFDVLRSPYLSKKSLKKIINYPNEKLEELKNSNGGIIVTAHIGNWEWFLPFFGLNQIKFSAVALKQKNKGAQKYFMDSRQKTGSDVILKGTSGKEMLNIIFSGGFLGLASDQNAGKRGVKTRFFNKEVSVPKGAAVFNLKTDCQLILCYCILNDKNGYEITFEPLNLENLPINKEDKINEIMQRISSDLEMKIKMYPHQYFWFHRKWAKSLYKA